MTSKAVGDNTENNIQYNYNRVLNNYALQCSIFSYIWLLTSRCPTSTYRSNSILYHLLFTNDLLTYALYKLYMVSLFDEGLWQQWPLPSTYICFWHITALLQNCKGFPIWRGPVATMAVALDRNLFLAYYSSLGFPIWRGLMTTMAVALDRNLYLAYYSSYLQLFSASQ